MGLIRARTRRSVQEGGGGAWRKRKAGRDGETELSKRSGYQPIKSTKQTNNPSTNPRTNKPTDYSTNTPTNSPTYIQPTQRPTSRSTDQQTQLTTSQPFNQPHHQPIQQPTNQPTSTHYCDIFNHFTPVTSLGGSHRIISYGLVLGLGLVSSMVKNAIQCRTPLPTHEPTTNSPTTPTTNEPPNPSTNSRTHQPTGQPTNWSTNQPIT